jgi:hypothetical protein
MFFYRSHITATATDHQSPLGDWVNDKKKFAIWADGLIVLFLIERNGQIFQADFACIARAIWPLGRPN